MIQNKIVARYQDGRMMKGSTTDFMPIRKFSMSFQLIPHPRQSRSMFLLKTLRQCSSSRT